MLLQTLGRAHLTEFEHKQADFVGQLAVYQAQEQELSAKLAEISREKEALQRMLEEGRCFTKAEVLRLKGKGLFQVEWTRYETDSFYSFPIGRRIRCASIPTRMGTRQIRRKPSPTTPPRRIHRPPHPRC